MRKTKQRSAPADDEVVDYDEGHVVDFAGDTPAPAADKKIAHQPADEDQYDDQ